LGLPAGQSAHLGFLQEPVGSFPEFLKQPSFQQGLDLVFTGVERLGRFLQRTEHVAHLCLPIAMTSVRSMLRGSSAI